MRAWHLLLPLLFAARSCGGETLFEVLGVGQGATDGEIRKAYRKLALELHPDKVGPFETDEEEERANKAFFRVTHAYETLSDPQKRREYQLSGAPDVDDGGGGGGTAGAAANYDMTLQEQDHDIYVRFRRGTFALRRSGVKMRSLPPIEAAMKVTIEDLFASVTREVTYRRFEICRRCNGTGASEPAAVQPCPHCGGSGRAMHAWAPAERAPSRRGGAGGAFRQLVNGTCAVCHGYGEIGDKGCDACKGLRTTMVNASVVVNLAPGAAPAGPVLFSGLGHQHPLRESGDFLVNVLVAQHPRFSVNGSSLIYDAKVTLLDALVGFERKLTLLDGRRIAVNHETPSFHGFSMRYVGLGLPGSAATSFAPGDLFIRVDVVWPIRLSDREVQVLREVLPPKRFKVLYDVIRLMERNRRVPISKAEARHADFCAYGPDSDPHFCPVGERMLRRRLVLAAVAPEDRPAAQLAARERWAAVLEARRKRTVMYRLYESARSAAAWFVSGALSGASTDEAVAEL